MIDLLPGINACLNALSAVLLLVGYRFIRNGRREAHRKTMLAAFGVSVLFLVFYLVYHAARGAVYYQGTGLIRTAYLTILATHTALAAAVPVLAIITLRRGLKGMNEKHRRIARWTLPIWLYVSVTGVIVYWMLYHS